MVYCWWTVTEPPVCSMRRLYKEVDYTGRIGRSFLSMKTLCCSCRWCYSVANDVAARQRHQYATLSLKSSVVPGVRVWAIAWLTMVLSRYVTALQHPGLRAVHQAVLLFTHWFAESLPCLPHQPQPAVGFSCTITGSSARAGICAKGYIHIRFHLCSMRETGWQIAAASFAVGAAAGATIGAYVMRRKMLESHMKTTKVDMSSLQQSLPDGGTGCNLSPAHSVSYSLPATPRISLSSRSLSRNDSLSSVSSVAVGGDTR